MSFSYENYYDLLDIPKHAGLEEIQRAYQKARALYSPDSPALYSMFTEDEARELTKVIDTAFQTLSNPKTRAEYDKSLSGESPNDIEESDSADIYGFSGESSGQETEVPLETHDSQLRAEASAPSSETEANTAETRFGIYQKNEEIEFYIQNEVNIDGEFLKTVREYKQVTVEQISAFTKIGAHHIRAIESNTYTDLPPLVFTKGFIRQFAGLLGLDQKKCADSYIHLMKQHIK